MIRILKQRGRELVGDDSGIELLPDYEKEADEWINN